MPSEKLYLNRYLVRDDAVVIDTKTGRFCRSRAMGTQGKLRMDFVHPDGKRRSENVDAVVANLFIPQEPGTLPCVIHVNGDVTDSRAVNLRWATVNDELTPSMMRTITNARRWESEEARSSMSKVMQQVRRESPLNEKCNRYEIFNASNERLTIDELANALKLKYATAYDLVVKYVHGHVDPRLQPFKIIDKRPARKGASTIESGSFDPVSRVGQTSARSARDLLLGKRS